MDTSPAGSPAPSVVPWPAGSSPASSSKIAWAAFTVALIALVSGLVAGYLGPRSAKDAIGRGDFEGVFTVQITLWAITTTLNLAAFILAVLGARRPVGKVLSGAPIAIGATGVLGLLVYLIQTGLIGFFL